MRWVMLLGIVLGILQITACVDEEIGQPCTFSWPSTQNGTDCDSFPSCAPLQNTDKIPGATPANDDCPVDCLEIPSLECTNLICVATQVEEGADKEQKINGQCSTEMDVSCGQNQADFGCMGYCTKECLSDASCPKGYRCTQMAPFGQTMNCENEDQWADGCTDHCTVAGGTIPGTTTTCPSSTADCNKQEYLRCCICLCYRYCPLLTKKYCRKVQWDQEQFPNGSIDKTIKNCGQQD